MTFTLIKIFALKFVLALKSLMSSRQVENPRKNNPLTPCSMPITRQGVSLNTSNTVSTQPFQFNRPLRVRHIVDSGQRHSVGRMVISGRMADVCAELDRLAAFETAT